MAASPNRYSRTPAMAQNDAGKLAKFVKSMLAIILIVAASVGATLFYTSNAGQVADIFVPAEPQAQPVVIAKPIFTPLEPFTVTLRTDRGTRILYVAVTLRVEDETSRRLLVDFMPEVRDRILRILSEQKADYIQTTEGRADLVRVLNRALERPYHPDPSAPSISSVLFTAFVIQ